VGKALFASEQIGGVDTVTGACGPEAEHRGSGTLVVFSALIWAGMFMLFLSSPVVQVNDSLYSMLTAESLIRNHSPDLTHYVLPDWSEFRHRGYPLARTNGRLLYGFAQGSSVLSAPFVALMAAFGVSPAGRDGTFNLRAELTIQKDLAALLSASTVTMFFLTASLVLSPGWSVLIALGAGLGTQVWSTASRGMWQHTWEIMLGAGVAYSLLTAEARTARLRPVLLATLVSWMFFVRPTGAVTVICVSAYVWIMWRSSFVSYAVVGAGWLAAFIAYSLAFFGTLIPFYYFSSGQDLPWATPVKFQPAIALYGTLVSPSRGLFIYCPIVAWVLFVVVRFWRVLKPKGLGAMALLASMGIWLVIVVHADWWGGACYGPRYMSDALPWIVLLAILAIAGIPPQRRSIRSPLIAAGALLLAVSIAMNAVGAWSWETMAWNFKGPSPDIMLDWSRPQFLAPWLDGK